MGVSENRGPQYSALDSRMLIIGTPKYGNPLNFRKVPNGGGGVNTPTSPADEPRRSPGRGSLGPRLRGRRAKRGSVGVRDLGFRV